MSQQNHIRRQPLNSHSNPHPHWGAPPWHIDFAFAANPFLVGRFRDLGGGFTGLAPLPGYAMRRKKSVAVLRDRIGAGASGRTGGMALAESAAGDLPGLGNVLGGLERILAELDIDCDLSLPGAFEIGRGKALKTSPLQWNDSGTLRVVKKVPGGTLDPGNSRRGCAGSRRARRATIIERCRSPMSIGSGALRSCCVHAGGSQCSAGKSSSPPMRSRSNSPLSPARRAEAYSRSSHRAHG